jgi:hypothetical protein
MVYGLYALSSVNHPVCHRRRLDALGIVGNLSARSLGRQDHTISPSALAPLVKYSTFTSTAFRLAFRDDRDTPLVPRRDAANHTANPNF